MTATAIRRVVVGLDASPASEAAARAAAEVAATLGAELVALYVEDRELLRLAEAPLATVVDRLFASSAAPAAAELESQLRAEGARARAGFERLVAGRGLRYSFRVVRGRIAGELVAGAGVSDLVVIGRVGAGRARGGLGSTARAVAKSRGGVVLRLADDGGGEIAELERWRAELGVEVVPLARSVLALAGHLAEVLERQRSPVLLVG